MFGKDYSLLFYLKKRSNYKAGEIPVYLRISVKGKRFEASTGFKCDPKR